MDINQKLPSAIAGEFMPDFAAKVRWRMVHDHNPLFPILQDKVAVKRYAHERGVATPRMYFVTIDPATLPFDSLPVSCFIKANHGCGWNILFESGEFFYFGQGKGVLDASGKLLPEARHSAIYLSRDQVVEVCRHMLSTRFETKEWAYQVIAPQIFVEEKLCSADGGELRDYRLFTFNGVVQAIGVGSATFRKNGENVFFTPDWEPIALTQYRERLPDPLPARPAKLNEMIAAAERLGRGIDFARVDLYDSTQGIMLGEMTLYPESGVPDSPTSCPRFNHWLSNLWQHPAHAAVQWPSV
jgi:hypothetical protein